MAEAIIAQAIAAYIFVHLYFPGKMVTIQPGLTAILYLLEECRLPRQNVVRSELLAAQEELCSDSDIRKQVENVRYGIARLITWKPGVRVASLLGPSHNLR